MKVIQLISSEGFYGAESMLLTLAEAQLRAGIRPVVAVFDDARKRDDQAEGIGAKAAERGIETHPIPCAGRIDLSTAGHLRRLLKQQRPSVLHCHGYKADWYGFAAAQRLRIPLVSTCHNWPDRRLTMRAYAAADRLVLRWFDQVTTPSKNVASILEHSGASRDRITVIANGIDAGRFQHASPTLRRELPGEPKQVIGCVARLIASKGGAVLIEAAKRVFAAFPDAAVVFVGEGQCRAEWQALAHQLGIGERVFFMGTRSDMPGVYASFDVLVLPSFDEAMPMCLLEGLAAGCPVIATDVGEVASAVRHGITGLLVQAGDSVALADAILQTLQSAGPAAERAANGRELIERTFSSAAMERNYRAIYERALCGRVEPVTAIAGRADSA
ncbi:MAG TPA: glycosyltransferase family 4 protein [Bryobacteraceae bacterium]|nr:glycosyltransferase family 4 protein [Bryobacteraceae bacterium]